MDHVVFFPAHDGTPAFRRVASIEDAVRLVEHLRNNEGVEQVSVHQLTEVPLSFKPYYRVELPDGGTVDVPVAAPGEGAAEVTTDAALAEAAFAELPEQEPAQGEGEPTPASLGFFAS